MEVSGQLNTLPTLPMGKESLVHAGWESRCASEYGSGVAAVGGKVQGTAK